MYPNQSFFESCNPTVGFLPLALTSARAGDYVSLKGFGRCAIMFVKGAGTAGDDPTITLRQAKDVSGTDVKDLVFRDVYVKQGADIAVIGTFTKISRTTPIATYTHTDAAEAHALWGIDVSADELDDGFDCIAANIGDVGTNAQLGALLYIPYNARYAPNGVVNSAIAD